MTEIYMVSSQLKTVICDGSKDNIPHPRVYLRVNPNTHCVTCPYCYQKICIENDKKKESAE